MGVGLGAWLYTQVCSDMHRFRTTAEHMFKQMAGGAGAGATGGSASLTPRITRQQFRTGLQQLGLGHASALRRLGDADVRDRNGRTTAATPVAVACWCWALQHITPTLPLTSATLCPMCPFVSCVSNACTG